jgi:hypothetical protein
MAYLLDSFFERSRRDFTGPKLQFAPLGNFSGVRLNLDDNTAWSRGNFQLLFR